VIVYAVSRFSRDTHDHLFLRNFLSRYGIKLGSVSEPAIDESPSGRLVGTLLSGFSQFDNDLRAAATKTGMKAAVEGGGWTWRLPLGYLKKGQGNDPNTIQLDPECAPLVTTLFQIYAKGTETKPKNGAREGEP